MTPRELALLTALLRRDGDVAPKHDLLHEVWGDDFDGDANVVEVYVGLPPPQDRHARSAATRLQTVRGAGYRMVASA